MSTESTATSSESSSQESSANQETGVNTQSESTQADITQSSESSLSTEETNSGDVEANQGANLNVSELIAKQLYGEKLSDADLESLKAVGLSPEQLSTMVEAQKQVQLKNQEELFGLVGGKQGYEELKAFALEHLSDDEIDAYNEAMASPNFKLAKIAALGLAALKDQVRGSAPAQRISESGTSASDSRFESQQDAINAMRDRRYGRDQEYTEMVNAKRAKSGF